MKKLILDTLTLVAAPWLASWIIRLIYLTMRKTFVGFEEYNRVIASGGQIILAFWHGRLLIIPQVYPRRRLTALISLSKDGELISRMLGHLGVKSVRGSSSRGGFGGVKGLLKAARDGGDLVITPDGPRGPGMKAQKGIVQIASKTGLPIMPVSFGAEKKKIFRSWDSFLLPYPFTRGVFVAAKPQYVASGASAEEIEKERQKLERTLKGLTKKADDFFKDNRRGR